MIRLLIVDDHAIVRKGLKQIFSVVSDIDVVAEAANGGAALDCLREYDVDLVLLDMTMPGISGEDLISRLHAHFPAIPILVLSMHNETPIVQRALKAGAGGYITKDREPEALLEAIRKVAAGGRFVDPQVAEQMVFEVSGASHHENHERLTDREFQILRLIARGMGGKEIAKQLSISNKTVSTHKTKLMEKMGLASTVDLVRYAIAHKLVD